MIEAITAHIIANVAAYVGGSIGLAVLTWILKKIPTEKIRKSIHGLFFKIGAGISKFFNNWKYTKTVYESTLEPWLIGFLDMVFMSIISGLFDGLRSDNKE
ncbi:hypothetical protein KAR91_68575 [Candidatus Pacearchaeota archaeon]|nr:hypothetical protein [Candidatus Pacearchaeota archaeon]